MLIRKEDGEDYDENKFQDLRVANFKLILLTSNPRPNPGMLERTCPFRVVLKNG